MAAWFNIPFLLANGDWMELIGLVVVFGFYVIGAIAKARANRSHAGGEDESETPPAVEKAKKYLKQSREKGRQMLSEWDRQQEMRRQKLAQLRRQEKTPQPVQAKPGKPSIASVLSKPQVKVVRQPKQSYPAIPEQIRYAQPTPPNQVKPNVSVQQTVKIPAVAEEIHKKPSEKKIPAAHPIEVFLKQPGDLRSAIILKEILDQPVALRQGF